MSNVIAFPRPFVDFSDTYFGVCPKCRRHDGFLNIGREHWFHCKRHKTKRLAGINLFSGWKSESEETMLANAALLQKYRHVAI